jgi:hypothetical protein
MILDLTDPVGTIQMIVSIVILVELIMFLDKEDMSAHIQERVAFYSGIFGKIWGFVKLAGEGFIIIANRLFPRKEKEAQPDIKRDFNEVYQMEDPEEEPEGELKDE